MAKLEGTAALRGYATIAVLALVPSLTIALMPDAPVYDGPPRVFTILSIVILLAAGMLRPLFLVVRRHPAPLRQLRLDLTRHWPRIAIAALMTVSLTYFADAVFRFKRAIPQLNPFFADPALIEFDRWLFLGYDAWQVSHALLGPLTSAIDLFYAFWHAVQFLLLLVLVFAWDRRFQVQAALTFQLSWLLLGNGLAMALSSVGPCFVAEFYGNTEFAPMMTSLAENGATRSLFTMDYLLASQGTNAIGAGISAMPSMHVGVAVLAAIMLRDRYPRLQWIGWLFALATFVGSVHLGWHYASDGLVSAVAVAALWKLSGRYIGAFPRPDIARREVAPAK